MRKLTYRTLKCHCKLVGKGIEYSWGCSKSNYHCMKIAKKRTKQGFRNVVRQCISRNLLTTVLQMSLWKKLTYHPSRQHGKKGDDKETSKANSVKIEKHVKLFKTHQCALTFDWGFTNAMIVKKEYNQTGEWHQCWPMDVASGPFCDFMTLQNAMASRQQDKKYLLYRIMYRVACRIYLE